MSDAPFDDRLGDGGLESFLRRQIAASGPVPLSEYMARCVGHYYAGKDPFGREGDFVTAPEISQMFGEVIGLWCAVIWQMMGEPEPIRLVELGPGRGTLMADLLRAAATLPAFRHAIDLHLVETSPALRERQRRSLAETEITWHDKAADLPIGPMIVIANEFFDSLPIDHYIRRADGWHERLVSCREDQFHFVDGSLVTERRMQELGAPEARLGDIFEVNLPGRAIAAMLGKRFDGQLGAALVVDYGGAASSLGDSLQAVRAHRTAPPLETPGLVDLTAHVDFAALARAATPARATPVVTQSAFLRRLGLELRAERLAAARPDQAGAIHAAAQRLLDVNGMGDLFKAMAWSSPDLTDLPGFGP